MFYFPKKKMKKAFTLIELIVVITILAILGTIVFISLSGYSKTARNSKRTSEINIAKKSLELFTLNTGFYPKPDNFQSVLYSGEKVWTQGEFGPQVTKNLSKYLSETLKDPILEIPYIYSIINNKKEYQLLGFFEGSLTQNTKLTTKTQANKNYKTKLTGTYNKIFVKTSSYIIPTPSIINVEIEDDLTLTNENIKSQATTGGENFPKNITGEEQKTKQLNISFNPTPIITKNSTKEEKEEAINQLQKTYRGSKLGKKDIYEMIINTKQNDKEKLADILFLKGNYKKNKENILLDGLCGESNNGNFLVKPTKLCLKGNATEVIDNGEGKKYIWSCNGINGGKTVNCSANHLSSYKNPSNFKFFRVNKNHTTDFNYNSAYDAKNKNGQSCFWKVTFGDLNGGKINYDIIESGNVLITLNGETDCNGGLCRKIINKCGENYDGLSKTAYIVKSGETKTLGAPSGSFTNNCVSNGNGNDGWDNDCDRVFDESVNEPYNCSCKTRYRAGHAKRKSGGNYTSLEVCKQQPEPTGFTGCGSPCGYGGDIIYDSYNEALEACKATHLNKGCNISDSELINGCRYNSYHNKYTKFSRTIYEIITHGTTCSTCYHNVYY